MPHLLISEGNDTVTDIQDTCTIINASLCVNSFAFDKETNK